MNINIIAVGRIREKYIKEGIDEFLKRIQPYSSIKVTEIEAENLKHAGNRAIETEGDKILNQISDNAFVAVMEVKGKEFSSEGFAGQINEINLEGYNQLVFIIGGALGLSQRVKNRGNLLLSMSRMTMPHQLTRLFLTEQIYRAFKILNNEPYHK